MRIWFNAGYSQTRDAIALIRTGAAADGLAVDIIASHSRDDAPALAAADSAAIEPVFDRSTDEGRRAYAAWCLDFARRHRITLFVAQRGRGDVGADIAAFNRIGCSVLVAAPPATLDLIENKATFYDACRASGLPTPISIPVDTLDAYRQACARIRAAGHQVCVKPPFGVFGSGYFRITDDGDFFRQLMAIDNRAILNRYMEAAIAACEAMPPLLVMQHLPGTEWSVDCLCDDGRIITGFVRTKRPHSQLIDADPALMALAARVAARFGLSNLVNIQFKAAGPNDENPHVLEINPRMSGGCAYGALAGINLPYLQLLKAIGALDEARLPAVRPTIAGSIGQPIDLGVIPAKLMPTTLMDVA